MKKLLIVAAVALSFGAHAKCLTRDKWTGNDKNMHFVAGAFIGAGATAQFRDPLAGVAAGVAIGALKELSDSDGSGTCSLQDLIATAIGAAVGAYGSAWLIAPTRGGLTVSYSTTF
jgi:hypothetical protein